MTSSFSSNIYDLPFNHKWLSNAAHTCPIPVIFPNFRSDDIFSIGSVLSKPDFFADDVVSNMVMTKDRMNLGYLGYKDSENRHSFPEYTDKKAKYLYNVLVGIENRGESRKI